MSIRSSVRKMTGYTPGEQPQGGDVVKLNTNENPYPPSPRVAEALATLDPARLRLYPDPSSSPLRARIAEIHGCRPAQVFAGNGSDETLALCTRAFVENSGSIGYFDPSYSLYSVLAEIRAVPVRPVPLGPDFAWTTPEPDACSLFFLTNPNAPTSLLYPRETLRAFCAGFEGVVVIDEAYVDFSDTDCMDFALELDNVLVARTLSKAYSLAGLRLGYLVGPEPLIEALFKIKDSYNVNTLTQTAALAALSDLEHMQANVAKVNTSRTRLSAALQALGFEVFPSQTNFVWARPAAIPAEPLFQRLKERHIFIRYFSGMRTGDYVRITIGTDEEIDRLLSALHEILG